MTCDFMNILYTVHTRTQDGLTWNKFWCQGLVVCRPSPAVLAGSLALPRQIYPGRSCFLEASMWRSLLGPIETEGFVKLIPSITTDDEWTILLISFLSNLKLWQVTAEWFDLWLYGFVFYLNTFAMQRTTNSSCSPYIDWRIAKKSEKMEC